MKTFFLLSTRFWVENKTSADVMTFFLETHEKMALKFKFSAGDRLGSQRPWTRGPQWCPTLGTSLALGNPGQKSKENANFAILYF